MVRRLNKYRKQAAGGESGFTLVEQVVTLAIVVMVLTAAMAALATGALGLNVTTSKNEAMSLAQAQMECIKNHTFDTDYTASGLCHLGTNHDLTVLHTHIEKPSGYKLGTEVSNPYSTDDNVQKIVVTVYRGENDVPVLFLEDLKVKRP